MEDINKVKEDNSLDNYDFVSEDARNAFYYAFDRITHSEDELRDLIYDMRHDDYCKKHFKGDDFKICIEKMEGIIGELDILYDDVIDVYKNKGLLIKSKD